jgi:serine/threonine protein kinase
MLTAMPPFFSKKRDDLFFQIRTRNPTFHSYLSKESVDLLSRLLVKDPSKRLTEPSQIKSHPFFKGYIDWKLMLSKALKSPYKPLLDSTDDTKHFDKQILSIPVKSPPERATERDRAKKALEASNIAQGDDEFDGFTFEAQTVLSNGAPDIYLEDPYEKVGMSQEEENDDEGYQSPPTGMY